MYGDSSMHSIFPFHKISFSFSYVGPYKASIQNIHLFFFAYAFIFEEKKIILIIYRFNSKKQYALAMIMVTYAF